MDEIKSRKCVKFTSSLCNQKATARLRVNFSGLMVNMPRAPQLCAIILMKLPQEDRYSRAASGTRRLRQLWNVFCEESLVFSRALCNFTSLDKNGSGEEIKKFNDSRLLIRNSWSLWKQHLRIYQHPNSLLHECIICGRTYLRSRESIVLICLMSSLRLRVRSSNFNFESAISSLRKR